MYFIIYSTSIWKKEAPALSVILLSPFYTSLNHPPTHSNTRVTKYVRTYHEKISRLERRLRR